MTSFHLAPDEILEGVEGRMLPTKIPCRQCEAEMERFRRIIGQLRESLTPPPMILATTDDLLARAIRGTPPRHGLVRVTMEWIALLWLAATVVCALAHLGGFWSAVSNFLHQTPYGLGLFAAAAALIAVIASPALVLLGHSQFTERSMQ